MTSFLDQVRKRWDAGRCISVGLDPEPAKMPDDLRSLDVAKAVIELNRKVIEGTAEFAAAFKPNIAFYEALGLDGMAVLHETIGLVREHAPDVPVIVDAKRADIGNTNDRYATAIFDVLGADAVTVNAYPGPEAMAPFLDRKDKGIIVWCRSSNPGADQYQDIVSEGDGVPLYQHIAQDVAKRWNANGNCWLVVGATYPGEMRTLRELAPQIPFLVPGIGAQGGDLEGTLRNGLNADGNGLLIHAGRSIMYAFAKDPTSSVQDASRAAIQQLQSEIDAARPR